MKQNWPVLAEAVVQMVLELMERRIEKKNHFFFIIQVVLFVPSLDTANINTSTTSAITMLLEIFSINNILVLVEVKARI